MGPAGKDAAPAVIDGLRSGRLQPGWASTTLYLIDFQSAVPFLLGHLRGPDAVLRKYAAAVLGFSGTQAKETLPVLTKAAKDDPEAEVRRIATWAIALIQEDYKTAAPLLIDGLKGQRGYNHTFSGQAFERWGPEAKDAVPILQGALADRNAKVRRTAARALGGIGRDAKTALPTLRKLLRDDDRTVRLATREALDKIAPET